VATSIPATKENGLAIPDGLEQTPGAISLSYPGKRPALAIRQTAPADVRPLWTPSPDPIAATRNRLYAGDNLGVLATLRHDPTVRGQVRLVYIDPPYASGGAFLSRTQEHAYTDTLAGADYVESLRERLILLRDLIAPDGSIYVHLDDYMAWTIKIVMDEVFGPRNYRNWITRKKCNPKNYTNKTYGNVIDYILFYTKSDDYVWHRPLEGWTPERAAKEYQYVDAQGRRHKRVPLHAPGTRNGATGQAWRGMMPPPGKHWQYTPETLDELDARGDVYWSKNSNPRRKVYFDESAGVAVQDLWLDVRDVHNQNTRITGYPTEKPTALLQRIIEASSNPDDIVLDCYAGSGTTLDAASSLGRRWIGVDNSIQAITTTLHRFAHGLRPMGDYVALRNGVSDRATGQQQEGQQLSFGLPETTDGQGSDKETEVPEVVMGTDHEPICDFTLYVEQSMAQKLPINTVEHAWRRPAQS